MFLAANTFVKILALTKIYIVKSWLEPGFLGVEIKESLSVVRMYYQSKMKVALQILARASIFTKRNGERTGWYKVLAAKNKLCDT